jgi:NADH-quinone oxidoreductase subunit D
VEQEDLREETLDLPLEPMELSMGPSHPAMHGTIRMVLKLDGETVIHSDVQPGFLHRGFEKMCERGTWTQVFPYTDRLNYVSPILNNVGYALAVEKLLGVTTPERCQFARVALGELARITDHLTCNGAMAMELGAFTPFLWMLKAREWIWEILEEVTGARLTHSWIRIGGLAADLSDGFEEKTRAVLPKVEDTIDESMRLLLGNRIFLDRTQGVGVISQADALSLGMTGVNLRSTGFDYDVRKAHPYLVYDRIDFDVPIGHDGDNYDRFVCRIEEMKQSIRIIRQALDLLPPKGEPFCLTDRTIVLPPKEEVYTSIEGTIQHFKLVMEGTPVPAGEVYSYTEAGNGELGFYLVSDGKGSPYRCRVRGPCFANLQGCSRMIQGRMIADIIPTFGSINMIAGECDR